MLPDGLISMGKLMTLTMFNGPDSNPFKYLFVLCHSDAKSQLPGCRTAQRQVEKPALYTVVHDPPQLHVRVATGDLWIQHREAGSPRCD